MMSLRDPPDRPDPGLYSQELAIGGGKVPTWDNPDIATIDPLSPFKLRDAASITVHNYAVSVTAVNVLVSVFGSKIEIGGSGELVGRYVTTIAGSSVAVLKVPLPANLVDAKEAAVRVEVSHPHDSDITNNVGMQALRWAALNSGNSVQTSVPLVNEQPLARQLTLASETSPNVQASHQHTVSVPASSVVALPILIARSAGAQVDSYHQGRATVYALENGRLLGGVTFVVV